MYFSIPCVFKLCQLLFKLDTPSGPSCLKKYCTLATGKILGGGGEGRKAHPPFKTQLECLSTHTGNFKLCLSSLLFSKINLTGQTNQPQNLKQLGLFPIFIRPSSNPILKFCPILLTNTPANKTSLSMVNTDESLDDNGVHHYPHEAQC